MPVWGRQLAEDEAKKYIYRNLAMFHRVQVSQMIHLPCLTETDRQKIRASCTNEGNNETTFIFFQRLCCRKDWVPPFVEALREQNMGDLADELESLYNSKLLPPRTPPAASAPPAANWPSAPPLRLDANEQSPPGQYLTENQALPSSPPRLASSSANPPPQDAGDYRTPIQENSHPAEKSRLAVHPKTTGKGAEPGSSSTSDVSSASNIGAAVGRDRGIESPDPDPVKESASVPCPVEERPLPSQTISTSADGNVEQNWDGRQHRPVTVKNGCFGNAHHPEDSGTGSALPTGASSNQPEEDYYSSDSISLALGGPREDSAAERKVHVLRGDQKRENPPVLDSLQSCLDSPRKNPPASHGSPENQTQLFIDPLSRRAPANDAQLPFTQMGTKPPLPVPNPGPIHPIRLPPSDSDGSSSIETKAPKSRREVSAAGSDKPSDDFKLPVEEERSLREITGVGILPQRGMETRPSAAGDHKRDSHIFHSYCSENDIPSKPGILSSVPAAEPSKLSSDNAGETNDMYSGSSERLRMSDSDAISVSTSDSDPILISESSSVGHSTPQGRNRASGTVDATLPPEVDAGEEDTSFRSYHLLVEKNPSMDLTEAPLDRASLRPSPRDFPDSTSDGQPENKAKNHQAGSSLPDKKVEGETWATSGNFWMLFAAFSVAFVAYVLYKKK
ncbi:mitochondrial antiviral-signaling protein [Pantherophis guttatus]|uniref:Mitochondrial antiviral-signaling protein n=1 Tax=Pantherophis guttatus TaxID=94885 RepID=A0A6P9AXZ3_PANGU|nr:mitochondrial antiviral-signaling protein [Pantherophis guttatus]